MVMVGAFILNLFAPVVNTMGFIGICGMGAYGDWHAFIWCAVMFVVGIVFGFRATQLDIAPRWFWSKSANDLFHFSVLRVLGYAWSFAMWPGAVYLIKCLVAAV